MITGGDPQHQIERLDPDLDAAMEQAAIGTPGGSVLEDEEILALGSSEDYGEDEEDVAAIGRYRCHHIGVAVELPAARQLGLSGHIALGVDARARRTLRASGAGCASRTRRAICAGGPRRSLGSDCTG